MVSYDSGKYKDIQLRVIVTCEWEYGFAFSDLKLNHKTSVVKLS